MEKDSSYYTGKVISDRETRDIIERHGVVQGNPIEEWDKVLQ